MAKSMSEALLIPHFGYYDEVDMSSLVQLRKELKGSPLLGNIPFSYMPVIIKVQNHTLENIKSVVMEWDGCRLNSVNVFRSLASLT